MTTALLDPATHLEAWTIIGFLTLIILAALTAAAAMTAIILAWHRALARAHTKDPEHGTARLRTIRTATIITTLIIYLAYTHALAT